MNKKSILCLISMVLLAGCGNQNTINNSADENKECHLQFYVYDNGTQYKRMANQFNLLHPNWYIEVRESAVQYFENLQNYFSADMAPDIFYMEPGEIAPFVRDGLILNIQSFIENGEDLKEEDLWPANDGYRYNQETKTFGEGDLYALAKDLSADYVMVYNKDHIVEYNKNHPVSLKDEINYPSDDGIFPSETTPMTWEQNERFCEKLSIKDGDSFKRYGTVFDYTPWRHTIEWVQQQGETIFSEDGTKFNAESQAVIDAFTHLTNYCYGDHVSSIPLDVASVGTKSGFKSQSISVVWAGRWSFNAYNWDECEFDIGLAPGPVKNAGDKIYATTNYVGLSISSTCKEPAVAYKFLEYLQTAGVRQEIRNGDSFNVPANKTIAMSETYTNVEDPFQKRLNNYFIKLTEIAEPLKWSPYINTTTFENDIAISYGHTWDNTSSYLTPAQALLQAKARIENDIRLVMDRM